MQKKLINIILILILDLIYNANLFATDLNYRPSDSLAIGMTTLNNINNFARTEFVKYGNIFTLNNLGHFKFTSDYGIFELSQNYQGNYLKIQENPFRDDENWLFNYNKPISNNKFGILFRQNLQFTSDSRNIGINKMMRLNGQLGLNYQDSNLQVEALYGKEDNNLLELKSMGDIYSFNFAFNYMNFESFILRANLFSNFLNLNYDRTNRDIYGLIELQNNQVDSTNYYAKFKFKNLQNNLLAYSTSTNLLPLEQRQESDYDLTIGVKYPLIENLNINFNISLSDMNVERFYKWYISDIPYSPFNRNVNQFELMFNSGIDFSYKNFMQSLKVGVSNRTESNLIALKYDAGASSYSQYNQIETQRDNSSSRINILSYSGFKIEENTSISATYNVQLFTYNTPSPINYDDRDEFNSIINFQANHNFSDIFNLKIEFENRRNHLVYIERERSSLNNWNIVYRYSTQLNYSLPKFSMHPKAEVLANYTVYDYENAYSSLRSISFRLISYYDSVIVKLSDKITSESNLSVKYSERGILYWNDFSESPQNGIYDVFFRTLIKREYTNGSSLGVGIKFYNYSQSRIHNVSQIEYELKSLSPEISINYVLGNWSMMINGWYEFQTINKTIKKEVPNLSIFVNLIF
jgi:hypothetical protein